MNRRLALALSCLLILHFLIYSTGISQSQNGADTSETTAGVPVLDAFHEVIFQIWHTAWPEKNIAMLVAAYPEVKAYSDSLAGVQLPGILRDRRKAWDENVAKLQAIVAGYGQAAASTDSLKLLDAAEDLHAQYEKLVRITRPILKEMDEFHKILYMIYHHYLPEKKEAELKVAIKDLKEKMAALSSATLPDRLKKREPAFNEARTNLAHSVEAIEVNGFTDNPDVFTVSIEAMHSDYQALEKVFE